MHAFSFTTVIYFFYMFFMFSYHLDATAPRFRETARPH